MFLILVFFRNPLIFLRALWHLLRCAAQPRFHYEYLASRPWLEESTRHGLAVRSPAGVPFAYSAAHVRARIELYEASRKTALGDNEHRRTWRRAFGPVTPGVTQLGELAVIANAMTGYVHPATTVKRWVNCLFVARYLYCLAVVLLSTFRGGVRGNESRILLFDLVVTFLAWVTVWFFVWYYTEGIGP